MKTQLGDLLDFPCSFTYKIMGVNQTELLDNVVSVIQQYAPGDYLPETKPSSKGNYQAISITILAQNIEQVETLYTELGNIKGVRTVL